MKKIYLSGENGKGKSALVDDADYGELSQYSWHLSNYGYAARTGWNKVTKKSTLILMHRVVAGTPTGTHTDHINRDRLDNRRANLRFVSRLQNQANTGVAKNNKLQIKGVKRNKNRFIATFRGNCLGSFLTASDAAQAYNVAATEYFGDYAYLNPVKEIFA